MNTYYSAMVFAGPLPDRQPQKGYDKQWLVPVTDDNVTLAGARHELIAFFTEGLRRALAIPVDGLAAAASGDDAA